MVESFPSFAKAVKHDDETGQRVSPPPSERSVQQQAHEDGAGKIGVNGVVEASPCLNKRWRTTPA